MYIQYTRIFVLLVISFIIGLLSLFSPEDKGQKSQNCSRFQGTEFDMVNGLLCNLFSTAFLQSSLDRYTSLTSPNKRETAVRSCYPLMLCLFKF